MEIDKSAKEPKMQVRTGGPPGDRTRNPRTKGTASAVHGSTRKPLASGSSGVEVRGDAWTHLQLRRLGYTKLHAVTRLDLGCRLPGWDRGLATT